MIRLIILICIQIVFLTSCTNDIDKASSELKENYMHNLNEKQLEGLKSTAKNLFSEYLQSQEESSVRSDMRIKDYKIQDDIKIFKNDYDTYYVMTYDTLPATKDYVLAGSGEMDDQGWHINRDLYVELIKKNGTYKLNVIGTGP